MTQIETTYRGHVIRYGENSDEWTCYDLGDRSMSSPSLSKVKARIDKMYLDQRKKAATSCFEIGGGYSDHPPEKTAGIVVEYLGPEFRRDYSRGKTDEVVGHRLAVVARRSLRDKASRAEKLMSALMPDTPEANAAYEATEAAYLKVKEAIAEYKAAFARIPRLTLEDIADLVRIKQTEASGADEGDAA